MGKKLLHNIIIILVLGQILASPKLTLSFDAISKTESSKISKKYPTKDFSNLISEISVFEEVEEDSHDDNNENLQLGLNQDFCFKFLNKSKFNNSLSFNFLNLGIKGSKLFILNRNLRI